MEKEAFERPTASKFLRTDLQGVPVGQRKRVNAKVMDLDVKPSGKSFAIAFQTESEDTLCDNVYNELTFPLNLDEAPAGKFKYDELLAAIGKQFLFKKINGKDMPVLTPQWAEATLFTDIVVEWEVTQSNTGGVYWKPVKMLPKGMSLETAKIEPAGV